MVGRPYQMYLPIYRELMMKSPVGQVFSLGTILVLCPLCGSATIGTNGTRRRKNGYVEAFQCHNSLCPFLHTHKYPKQFILTSSFKFKEEIWGLLNNLFHELTHEGAKNKTIAHHYQISEGEVSQLRKVLEEAIERNYGLDKLVMIPQTDEVIAMDETFFTIEGTSVYLILATGYISKKTLGLKISESRKLEDLKTVFDEAQKNVIHPITLMSVDGWGAYQTLAKDLKREFTLVIHPHKKPYNLAWIMELSYDDTTRKITQIGVKTDIFEQRATREFHYLEQTEPLSPPQPKPKGRPKGTKNGQGRKKRSEKKQRGRKGFKRIFTKGKKGYVKVDPYRKTIRFSKDCPATVATGLDKTFHVFAGMSIQNNQAENINSVIESLVRMRGPRTMETLEQRLRATVIIRNDPSILDHIEISRQIRGEFLLKNMKARDLLTFLTGSVRIQKKEGEINV
jgi:hypothetical protein